MVLFIVLLGVGFSAGYTVSETVTSNIVKKEKVRKEKAVTEKLTDEKIEKFLIVYFTKKDLSENRNRYKPFLTREAYRTEIEKEESPLNQAYKGYVINQVYRDSKRYINEKEQKVIVEVDYVVTLLANKEDLEHAQKDVLQHQTLELHYVNQDGEFLIHQMDALLLDRASEDKTQQVYPFEGDDNE